LTLPTLKDLVYDSQSYWFTMISLFSPPLDKNTRNEICERWIHYENYLAKLRAAKMKWQHIIRVIPDCKRLNVAEVCPSFKQLYPHENDCFQVPFEYATHLMPKRQCVVQGGDAYVHRQLLVEVLITYMQQHNANNIKMIKAKIHNQLPIAAPIRGLMEGFMNKFTQLQRADVDPREEARRQHSMLHLTNHTYLPGCIQALHTKAYALGWTTSHHLKNDDRILYGMFMVQNGADIEDMFKSWQPRMKQVYGNEDDKKVKSLYGMKKFFEDKKHRAPVSCSQMISRGLCPYARGEAKNVIEAQQSCGARVNIPHVYNPGFYLNVMVEIDAMKEQKQGAANL